MTQEEFDKNKFAAQRIINVAEELIRKLDVNDRMIADRRVSTAATSSLSREFISVLNQILNELKSPQTEDLHIHLENIAGIISSVAKQLEENVKSSNDEIIKLESIQEGMRRGLQAVRDSGAAQVLELEKIDRLSEEDDPEARRKVGEHPETFSAKRNASTLKKSRESSNT